MRKDPQRRTDDATEIGHGPMLETAVQHQVRTVLGARAAERVGVRLRWLLRQTLLSG